MHYADVLTFIQEQWGCNDLYCSVDFSLKAWSEIADQALQDKLEVAKDPFPFCVRLVGQSGAGKTYLLTALAKKLHDAGKRVIIMDCAKVRGYDSTELSKVVSLEYIMHNITVSKYIKIDDIKLINLYNINKYVKEEKRDSFATELEKTFIRSDDEFAFSNTYGSIEKLKKTFEPFINVPNITDENSIEINNRFKRVPKYLANANRQLGYGL